MSRPAGIEAFAKCPTTGCPVMVYGPRLTENHCRAHGGAPAFELDTDEYGNPRATVAEPPRPPLAPLEAR